ncbi:MAG: MOSC domain-containing protein [Candidatus Binataceae bacterium]|nr:MOSC domain-containing protein [Candidatus Binataceae bacterium]
MMGEELNGTQVTARGIAGDRAYALIDRATGKVASAKNPQRWPGLFRFRAAYAQPLGNASPAAPVWITLPDGATVASGQEGVDQILSGALGRAVVLQSQVPDNPSLEEYWPAVEQLARQDQVTDEAMPPATFFDCATVHLLTTGTLDRLRGLYPAGRFEPRRFRPNIVIAAAAEGFVENSWVGRTVAIGPEVRLLVTGATGRCVMTTLAQGDLPRDLGILRTAAQHNQAHVGIYASVVRGGAIRSGDEIHLE